MCCKTVYKGKTYRPGDLMPVRSSNKSGKGRWVGFARSETALATWGAAFPVELDVPTDRFAERNRVASKAANTRVETEASVPKGQVIYALGRRKTGGVRILTREATATELANVGHNRMPVVGPSRF